MRVFFSSGEASQK